jgi:hypothetical protein
MVIRETEIWPETIVGWLTTASLLFGMIGLWIKQDRAKQKVMHDLNVVSHRAQDTAQKVIVLEEKMRAITSLVERFETKVELILERLIESRQEADRRVVRYEEGMRSVMSGVTELREDTNEGLEKVRDRLTRVEEAIKHIRDES